jgi:hypothetical protein
MHGAALDVWRRAGLARHWLTCMGMRRSIKSDARRHSTSATAWLARSITFHSAKGQPPASTRTRLSTTVTVTTLSRAQGRGVQDGADAIPQTILTPALIATVGGMPRAVGRRHLTPRNPGAHDREQTLEQTAVRHCRTATRRLLRWQEGGNLLPEGVAERRSASECGREWWVRRPVPRLARRPLGHMVPPRAGLMTPPPVRPLESRAPPGVLGLAQEEQHPAHLGQGQRDPLGRVAPPFPSRAALWRVASRVIRRVTSSAAWASRARVT